MVRDRILRDRTSEIASVMTTANTGAIIIIVDVVVVVVMSISGSNYNNIEKQYQGRRPPDRLPEDKQEQES